VFSADNHQAILTAASSLYGPSLLALLGSLHLNWPGHPPVRVYDIGLDQATLDVLKTHHQTVIQVPPFCPHWRKHFTWKIWCLNEAPARQVLWLDAGLVVLQPLDGIFAAMQSQGYFAVANYHLLDWEASEAACAGCGVPASFRLGKPSLAGGVIGFQKEGKTLQILQEALAVAMNEENIRATHPRHRHEQAILSLLMYKYLENVLIADGQIYAGWKSPDQVFGQKIWVHRRGLLPSDLNKYVAHISQDGPPYHPLDPAKNRPFWYPLKKWYRSVRRWIIRLRSGGGPEIYDGVRDK
jgi:hypothetical protein